MKAAVLRDVGILKIEDMPEPQPGPDQIKVKVAYCGVCGTDPEIVEGRFVPPEWTDDGSPRIIGHESSGTIVAVGSDIKNFKVGQRVACNFRSPCGACYYCRSRMENFCLNPIPASGGFAEYAVYKESAVTANFSFRPKLPFNFHCDKCGSILKYGMEQFSAEARPFESDDLADLFMQILKSNHTLASLQTEDRRAEQAEN